MMKFFAALIAITLALGAQAHAQQSKATIIGSINTEFADNTTGAITAADLRNVTTAIVSSYVDWLTCTTSGGMLYWNASAAPACLANGTAGQVLKSGVAPYWSNTFDNLTAGAGITITGTVTPTILISTNAVLNTMLGTMTPATLKGNPTASLATPTDFTIQGLTQLVSPSATLDFLVIYDAATGTLKRVNPNSLASSATAGVFFSGLAPADNTIPRYDGTTGTLIQTSGATITDAGLLTTTIVSSTTVSATSIMETPQVFSSAGVKIRGTNTNDNAPVGYVGEIIESTLASGSAAGAASGTALSFTNITLTAGDWDVFGNICTVFGGGTTMSRFAGGISSVVNTEPTPPNSGAFFLDIPPTSFASNQCRVVGTRRVSINANTVYYITGTANFAVSTLSLYGYIGARRVR